MPYFRSLLASGASHLPITDERMTRFWISLQQGVNFVLRNFQRMHGGEIFVPKIPSIRITDLAKSIAPDLPHKIVGIRPGEKLHETMCPADDSRLTLEFADHYVIRPSITFTSRGNDFNLNNLGEPGHTVASGFEYESGANPHFLDVPSIAEFNRLAEE